MTQKTQVDAAPGKQEIIITRTFELPLDLLFKAYVEPDLVEQWMGTKVLKLDNVPHGSYTFETTDPKGNKHVFHGVIHAFVPLQKITRTFEMRNTPFPAQLEFLEFDALSEDTSKLTMHIVFKSVAYRDQLMQMPFAQGINMAHDRLQTVANKYK